MSSSGYCSMFARHYPSTPVSIISIFASSLAPARFFKIRSEHFLISVLIFIIIGETYWRS